MIIVVSSTCRIHFNHNVFMPQDLLQTWCHHLSASMRVTGVPGPMIPNHVITSQDPFHGVSSTRTHHNHNITSQDPWYPNVSSLLRIYFNHSVITSQDPGHPIVSSSSRIQDTQLCHHLPGSISTMVLSSRGSIKIMILSPRIQDTQWCCHLPGSTSTMYHLPGSSILGAKYYNSCISIVFWGHMAPTSCSVKGIQHNAHHFPLPQKWSTVGPSLMTPSLLWPFLMMSLTHS
ncbi:hypothetical protein mRhiFer1_009117 [Rhinolophus ferrumequinum]|uniref:Uncharacterized protein n=1 Tax=Rhinolophus ferrumequinum TaxID=59479 RepID=A0A7J7SIW2_RHIFE|nr:hypothetical protein mRhiFer1_009117 [Rhinolophus ferrumequinum]